MLNLWISPMLVQKSKWVERIGSVSAQSRRKLRDRGIRRVSELAKRLRVARPFQLVSLQKGIGAMLRGCFWDENGAFGAKKRAKSEACSY